MSSEKGVRFLYGTALGRSVLKTVMLCRLDKVAVWFLCSSMSRCVIPGYIKRHNIPMNCFVPARYDSFRSFFLREKKEHTYDSVAEHLISPCDGWLSAYPIREDSSFRIKGSYYRISDLLNNPAIGRRFNGGVCLVFRLSASDYHHYCYVDDGIVAESGFIEGKLHSVQPIACETYPVYSLNRRAWSLLETEHFGSVVQTEIGALIVGGIVNNPVDSSFSRGDKKGHFDLSGSTIVLLMQKDTITLQPWITDCLMRGQEARVAFGMRIGSHAPSAEAVS